MVTNQCCHKVWMDSNKNCGRNSTLKIIAAYGPVLNSKCLIFCNFWQIAKKVTACVIIYVFGWIGWKLGEEQSFKNCKLEILQSAPNDPKPNSRSRASKVPSICALQDPESQIYYIFVSIALRLAVFKIFHILGLGLYMGPNNLCCVTPHFLSFFRCPMSLYIRNLLPHVTFYNMLYFDVYSIIIFYKTFMSIFVFYKISMSILQFL